MFLLKNLHDTVPRLKSEKINWHSNSKQWELEDHSHWVTVTVIEQKELAKGRSQESQMNKSAEGVVPNSYLSHT